jgi:hypothetical protein
LKDDLAVFYNPPLARETPKDLLKPLDQKVKALHAKTKSLS